jgi:hypothetical protein
MKAPYMAAQGLVDHMNRRHEIKWQFLHKRSMIFSTGLPPYASVREFQHGKNARQDSLLAGRLTHGPLAPKPGRRKQKELSFRQPQMR